MKYTIEGLQQSVLVDMGLDATDAIIIRWMIDFWASGRMKIVHVEGREFRWISYKYLAEDLPIIRIANPQSLRRRLLRMEQAGILSHHHDTEGGSFSCYAFQEKALQSLLRKGDPLDSKVRPLGLESPTKDPSTTSLDIPTGYPPPAAVAVSPAWEKDEGFQTILSRWNSLPSVNHHDPAKVTKTLSSAFRLYKALRAGRFIREASNLTPDVLSRLEIPASFRAKKWTVEEILAGIDALTLQWESGYWPFSAEEKKRILPKSLESAFYSPHNKGCPCPLFAVVARPPRREDKVEPKNPGAFADLKDCFEQDLYRTVLSKTELTDLALSVNALHEEAKRLYDFPGYLYTVDGRLSCPWAAKIGNGEKDLEVLVTTYIDYLKDRYWGIKGKWNEEGRSGQPVTPKSIRPGSRCWSGFVQWMAETHSLYLAPNDEQNREITYFYGSGKKRLAEIKKKREAEKAEREQWAREDAEAGV